MYLRRKRHDPRTTRPSHAGVVPFPFGRGFRRTSARGWRAAGAWRWPGLPWRGATVSGSAATRRPCSGRGVFCQIEVVQNGVSIQSEKAAGFSPIERKDPPPLLFGFYPIRAWVRLYDSPSNLIILP